MMTPATEAELSEMIASARGPLRIQGGGTRPIGMADQGEVLGTSGLSGITLYEPGALTMVAQAGTPLAEVEAALAQAGQRLAFEPMDHRGLLGTTGTPTIGGVVAGNISGPRRIAVGACRDFLLGVRFVDGQGRVLKNGGRVMKNVTGYDLVKLMAGSWGTLGVLSEVSFKVLPIPQRSAALVFDGLDNGQAIKAMCAALGSPFEVSGAAHVPEGKTVLRIEGFAASVGYRAQQLQKTLAAFGVARVIDDEKQVASLWRDLRDVVPFHGVEGDVWRLSVKPTDGAEIAARLQAARVMFDWGGGLIWALMPQGTDARARLGAFQGHATLIRAGADTRSRIATFHPDVAALAKLSQGLRARFDPRGILNARLMGAALC